MAGSRQAGAGRGLTLVQVDIVLPLLLVSRAVVSGALEDVSPVPDVMPDGHLLQPAVRVAHGPPGLPDLGEVESHMLSGSFQTWLCQPGNTTQDLLLKRASQATRLCLPGIGGALQLTPPGAERISDVSW